MDILIIMLVGFGLAFDVFAIAVSQGAVLGDVRARGLVFMCLIVCAWQAVALGLGYMASTLPGIENRSEEVRMVWTVLSACIFIALGGVKIFLIYYKKAVAEVKQDINFKKICSIAATTSIYTFFAGFACGLLAVSTLYLAVVICIMTIGLVIIGVYVGYRNGELNKSIYRSGGAFLIIAGIVVIMRYVDWYFK